MTEFVLSLVFFCADGFYYVFSEYFIIVYSGAFLIFFLSLATEYEQNSNHISKSIRMIESSNKLYYRTTVLEEIPYKHYTRHFIHSEAGIMKMHTEKNLIFHLKKTDSVLNASMQWRESAKSIYINFNACWWCAEWQHRNHSVTIKQKHRRPALSCD